MGSYIKDYNKLLIYLEDIQSAIEFCNISKRNISIVELVLSIEGLKKDLKDLIEKLKFTINYIESMPNFQMNLIVYTFETELKKINQELESTRNDLSKANSQISTLGTITAINTALTFSNSMRSHSRY